MKIDHKDFQFFAADLLNQSHVSELQVRRAVSALYYGLFHRLAGAGASVFQAGGLALSARAARAYGHSAMLDVCKAYSRSHKNSFPQPLNELVELPVDDRLVTISKTFIELQEARHAADYDLIDVFGQQYALALLELAELAHRKLDEVSDLPQTTVFLTALLLHDRWKRRA